MLISNENPNLAWPAFKRAVSEKGAVLLEVVVALVLFVGAVAIITGGLNASVTSVERLRLKTHAANLAISVLSELQIGTKSLAFTEPQRFEPPFADWTWETAATPVVSSSEEVSALNNVEVVIRHDEPPVVYRLSQVLRLDDAKPAREWESAFP